MSASAAPSRCSFCGTLAQVHEEKADFLRDKNKSSLATAPKHHISDSHGMEEVDSARRGREGAVTTPAGNLPPQDSFPLGILIICISR